MFKGKLKAVTFSYDDGVKQDKRLISLLDKYNLKSTFNINSGFFGQKHSIDFMNVKVDHSEIEENEVKKVYEGHEVAVHTTTHPNLTKLGREDIIRQVEDDRIKLERLVGYKIIGMAYPCGGENNNDFVAEIIKNNTPIKYCRTILSTGNFDLQSNLHRFNPTVYHMDIENLFTLGEKFITLKTDKPQVFYIWGHSYELDIYDNWKMFEEFCKMISGKSDIYYGTNSEVLLFK